MNRFASLTTLLLLLTLATVIAPPTRADGGQKHILVTGTSTGIGRNLAETLAREGHHVYAGVRKDKDFEALNAIENITAVRMDVTRQDEIDAAVAFVREQGTGLYALVNNAGVGGGGAVAETTIENQTFVYDINVEGVYRVTKAFAPLIIESRGRIATTGSIAGTLSWAGGSAYAGSKHWIEAFTDALAAEMAPAGVSVSVIQPGNYQSFIRRSSVLRSFQQIEAAGGEVTDEMRAQYKATEERELSFKQPDEVSAAYLHALFDEAPLRRYVVTPSEDEQAMTINTKLSQLAELNQWGPYSYTRDELIDMLDRALEAAPPLQD